MKIAIIDVIGLTYDGTTLQKRGLGGSESAVILMSKELAAVGFDVTVYNACIDDDSKEGTYDGVRYIDVSKVADADEDYDIVISSRTVVPFCHPSHFNGFPSVKYHPSNFLRIRNNAKLKVLWMHDTFCLGDELIEDYVTGGLIDEIFTLSDFHTAYITNCAHGKRRNFEVLKNKVFVTRNGITKYMDEVNVKDKDPNLFVYNASVTKGMIPLVEKVWPMFKQHAPNAKLKIIGGYYRFRSDAAPDAQENVLHELEKKEELKKLDIEFTGIITQREIANILAKASFFIFPGAFPETFGISSLESLYYNTPLITCRFGAVEETAVELASYFIDYAIEPNVLFPHINTDEQVYRFVNQALNAYNNKYLHQQKMYYCNIVKDIAGWDTIALQWKQHFFRKLGEFLPVDDYRKVMRINRRVHAVFGRRFSNKEEWGTSTNTTEQKIVVISPFYNAAPYIERCIRSVAAQDYSYYHHVLIDDCSTDDGYEIAKRAIESTGRPDRYTLIRNQTNQGAMKNQYDAIYQQRSGIMMLLDGDDWLVNDSSIFTMYNTMYYHENLEFTYGSCWSIADNIPLIAQHYPRAVREARAYRQHLFNWNLPYTHLRTFTRSLFDKIDVNKLKDEEGNWFKAGGDGALFYALIEEADPDKIKAVPDIVYNYNDLNPLNDYKVNGEEQTKNANKIIGKQQVQIKKKILIAIPTAKNIEAETFKSIYDQIVPDGYETHFQFFYGYNIDQVRNLIADWVVRGYDYLFSVDSDMSFPPDTLKRLIEHDKDVVTGLYRQRKQEQILEVYEPNAGGGVSNIPYWKIANKGLVEIAGCGFGCVLVKAEVMRAIGYPQFKYHSALDHANTISEDVYFCRQARDRGFQLFADTTILCGHVGSTSFNIVYEAPDVQSRLRELGQQPLLPVAHAKYLKDMNRDGVGLEPKVIYDIGACVLHWTNVASTVWPEAQFIAFDAADSMEFLYKERGIPYHIGLLSSESGKEITFYQNDIHPGGNSYYKENERFNPEVNEYFNDSHKRIYISQTLDEVVAKRGFPLPDLIKMDVQGAEMDVLRGASKALDHCTDLILELQQVEYNTGAPLNSDVIDYLNEIGFELVTPLFSNNGPDGDYHFRKRK
jgi:FkbM family methyltransferase